MFKVFLNQILLLQFVEAWGSYCYSESFCWQNLHIFVRKDQSYNKTDISLHSTEQVLEICAILLETKAFDLVILSLYRAPTNFIQLYKDIRCYIKLSI
jgi:hypothetical protein